MLGFLRLIPNLRVVRIALIVGAVVAAFGVVLLVMGPIAWWVGGNTVAGLPGKERADSINAVRQTLLAAVTGLAAGAALVFTGRSFFLNRRGKLTDRYAKALSLLASEQAAERLGGVFALEHLMRESERDHDTIVQVLAAFVRERRPLPDETGRPPAEGERRGVGPRSVGSPRCPADVQAALTVLGRRPDRREFSGLDLSHADLSGANLEHAKLHRVDFRSSRLTDVNLVGADLTGADLHDVVLVGANLSGAALHHAVLVRADLRHAILEGARAGDAALGEADLRFASATGADLTQAHLLEARLTGTDLSRAVLRDAYLHGANLEEAILFAADLSGADLTAAVLGAADLRHASLTGATLDEVRAHSVTRDQLEQVLDQRLAVLGQIRPEVFETLDRADSDRANWTGVATDGVHREIFPGTRSLPAPPPTPGFVIGKEKAGE